MYYSSQNYYKILSLLFLNENGLHATGPWTYILLYPLQGKVLIDCSVSTVRRILMKGVRHTDAIQHSVHHFSSQMDQPKSLRNLFQ